MVIGISGRINSGKDTVGKIIQYLTSDYSFQHSYQEYLTEIEKRNDYPEFHNWQIKKFADKLKDIVCLLIGCTRKQLEDREFKNKELGEEWDRFTYLLHTVKNPVTAPEVTKPVLDPVSGKQCWKFISKKEYENTSKEHRKHHNMSLEKMTPRKLLQLLGTECGRDIIHPNIWINALFSNYKPYLTVFHEGAEYYPDWIITDLRFPNEAQAIRNRKGILIRVERPLTLEDCKTKSIQIKETFLDGTVKTQDDYNNANWIDYKYTGKECDPYLERALNGRNAKNGLLGIRLKNQHYSETALDDYKGFHYTIHNNGTIEDLINKVKEILIDLKIISNESTK